MWVVFGYVIGTVIGVFSSRFLSGVLHGWFDLGMGHSLAKLGVHGIFLWVILGLLPSVFGAVGAGYAFYRMKDRVATTREVRSYTLALAVSCTTIFYLFIILSGVWFGLIQANAFFIIATLTIPPAVTILLFWIVFPWSVRSYLFLRPYW